MLAGNFIPGHVQWLALARHNESNDWHKQRRQRISTHHDSQNALHRLNLGLIVSFLCRPSLAMPKESQAELSYLQRSPQLVRGWLRPRILADDAVRVLQEGSHGGVAVQLCPLEWDEDRVRVWRGGTRKRRRSEPNSKHGDRAGISEHISRSVNCLYKRTKGSEAESSCVRVCSFQ